jgi:hypothetical protein
MLARRSDEVCTACSVADLIESMMKTVGRRRIDGRKVGALQETLAAMRRTGAVVPRGVYRFSSFEEADAWMTRMTARRTVCGLRTLRIAGTSKNSDETTGENPDRGPFTDARRSPRYVFSPVPVLSPSKDERPSSWFDELTTSGFVRVSFIPRAVR